MRFVTMATDDFVPGVMALIQSVIDNSGFSKDEIKFTVLQVGEFSQTSVSRIQSLPVNLQIISVSSLGEFGFNTDLLKEDYKREIQNKFLLFKLPYDEKICYVDADQICLNDITSISEFDHLTAGINIGKRNPEIINHRPMFNTGLFVCEPSDALFNEIQEYANEISTEMEYADQRILNEFFYTKYPESVNILSFNWNVLTSSKYYQRKIWKSAKQEGIRFLHYTSIKPWFVEHKNPPERFQYHRYKYILYRNEVKTWSTYYNKALKHSVQH